MRKALEPCPNAIDVAQAAGQLRGCYRNYSGKCCGGQDFAKLLLSPCLFANQIYQFSECVFSVPSCSGKVMLVQRQSGLLEQKHVQVRGDCCAVDCQWDVIAHASATVITTCQCQAID
eukprot:s724_g19.t1